jgi:hypothetical protein
MKVRGDAAAAPRRAALLMNVLREILFENPFNSLIDLARVSQLS